MGKNTVKQNAHLKNSQISKTVRYRETKERVSRPLWIKSVNKENKENINKWRNSLYS